MPIYEYVCSACGEEFEALQKFSDKPLTQCTCGKAGAVQRKLSLSAFQLKGGGWYKDLYGAAKSGGNGKSEGAKTGGSSQSDSAKADGNGAKADSKAESKPDKGSAKSDGGAKASSAGSSAKGGGAGAST